MRPVEWRNAKRMLAEYGWEEGLVEEVVDPTTSSGAIGLVEPVAVRDWVATLDVGMRSALLRYFAAPLSEYAESCHSLADFGEYSELPPNSEVIVPWSGVMLLREPDGSEHLRP